MKDKISALWNLDMVNVFRNIPT